MIGPILFSILMAMFRTMTKAQYKAMRHKARYNEWLNGDPE